MRGDLESGKRQGKFYQGRAYDVKGLMEPVEIDYKMSQGFFHFVRNSSGRCEFLAAVHHQFILVHLKCYMYIPKRPIWFGKRPEFKLSKPSQF